MKSVEVALVSILLTLNIFKTIIPSKQIIFQSLQYGHVENFDRSSSIVFIINFEQLSTVIYPLTTLIMKITFVT